MNLTHIYSGKQVFINVECINGYTFKAAAVRGKSALFQAIHPHQAVLCSSFTPGVLTE